MKNEEELTHCIVGLFIITRQHSNADAQYRYSNYVRLSVRLSVRPSVWHAPVLYQNALTYHHAFLAYGSPIILVFLVLNMFAKFWRVRWIQGYINLAIFDQCLTISGKRYNIGPKLLRNGNRKSYALYRIVTSSDDLEWPLKVISVLLLLCGAQLTRDLLAIAKFLA